MQRRTAAWLVSGAALTALGLGHASNRPSAPRAAPIVTGPSADPIREVTAARSSANRFLELYASAAAGHLSAAERKAIEATSASQVAELLVEQPPEKLRRGGRVVRLSIEPAAGGGFSAVGTLSFQGLSEVLTLTIARYPEGSWRVTTFDPTVAAPNRGARH